MDQAIICRETWQKMLLESMPIGFPIGENCIKARTKRFSGWAISRCAMGCLGAQTQLHAPFFARGQIPLEQTGCLGARTSWIDGTGLSLHHIAMETILLEGGGVGLVIQTLQVCFVVGKQPIALLPAVQ